MPRLVDYAERQAQGLPGSLEELIGQEVTIVDVEFSEGQYGPYAVIHVPDANGEVQIYRTTGFLVIDALEHASAEEAFPCEVTFKKRGRTFIME